jgi:hypothetical protein
MFPTNYGDRKPGVKLGLKCKEESITAWRNRVNGLKGGKAKPDEARKAGFTEDEIRKEFNL